MAAETSVLHTKEQGRRVHVLANLGGLAAIAGLERVEPPMLLGALLEVADRLPRMKPEALARLEHRGSQMLDERGTSKRAWAAHKTAHDLHAVHLSTAQICTLLEQLGAPVPRESSELPMALAEALRDD